MSVRATILVPTHNRPDTLRVAVASALNQSVRDLEVLIIGDGATDAARAQAIGLADIDGRVRFLDREKGPNHGEIFRHDAILEAGSDAIFYLCDDDLFMHDHVSDLLELLVDHNFVQSRDGWINGDGNVDFFPADIADPATIEWHLRDDVRYNAVGITGTAHSREFYLAVGEPWDTTPAGEWPDHHQWRKLFRHAELRAATSSRMTALQFPTTRDGRESWSPDERLRELQRWAVIAAAPDGQQIIDALIVDAAWRRMERDSRGIVSLQLEVLSLHHEVDSLMGSRSWRLTKPLREARRRITHWSGGRATRG